jgi:signal transduction protein with GAF and PtsI domain
MNRPTAQELTEAIEEFLGSEILPTVSNHRLRFRVLVAMNALGIVYRELAALPAEDDAGQRELARRIRAGDVAPETLAQVKADVEARLLVASPKYLERYG